LRVQVRPIIAGTPKWSKALGLKSTTRTLRRNVGLARLVGICDVFLGFWGDLIATAHKHLIPNDIT
jgi:hypothetical protein